MKNKLQLSILLMMSIAFSLTPIRTHATENKHTYVQSQCLSPAMAQLQGDLRRNWIDHTIWTRSYIVSALAGLDDQKDVLERLLRNQQDIGNAVKPYYGEAAGNKLAELLREHILIAGKVVDAAKSGNQADLKRYNKEWYRNADDIAKFLSAANPNWTLKELQDLLYVHLQLLTDQVNARLMKDWKADILAFDKGEDHIIKLADTLTQGIVKQFPEKFK
ncbi:glycosyltransferase [Paenibacillus thermoaerophilus]|uniref:Glycosyltransferase n=1 Tax=Paenibacillus thermoaerophilus TaxID=1215385 RepID=A0ABW2V3C1_9BACL|nr:glycosyltransferase [Paenibacillus thermoaerophilus]TMV14388.1 glycosyltransferase [Paenibacillus thermoaerophilus]